MSPIWMENVLAKQPSDGCRRSTKATRHSWQPRSRPQSLVPKSADLAQWRWGKFSPVAIENRCSVASPGQPLDRPGLNDQSGGSYTVKQVSRTLGPSERYTADLSDLDQSTLNTVTGQGGNFLSPHYMDQWKAWYQGTTFQLPFSPQAVERTKAHRLVLEPGR